MSVNWPKVILFGDSLVQRSFEPTDGLWGALLAYRLQRICDVVTRGLSGYTTRSCLHVLRYVFQPHDVEDVSAFVICIGTNDSSGKDAADPLYVSLEEYSQNLDEILNYLEEIGLSKKKVILMTPGPYYHEKFMKWCSELGRTFPERDNETALKYVEACLKVAEKHNIDAINVYQEMMQHEDWPKFLLDGVHYSNEGSNLIFKTLLPLIEKRVDTSGMILPYWRDINPLPKDVDKETISKLIADSTQKLLN